MEQDGPSLKEIYDDQRAELGFRRTREQAIFAWSSAVLAAVVGWALVSSSSHSTLARLGPFGPLLAAVGVFVFAVSACAWQVRQRSIMRGHQRVLASLAVKRGWLDVRDADGNPLLPDKWRWWGRDKVFSAVGGKVCVTAALGLICFTVVLVAGLR